MDSSQTDSQLSLIATLEGHQDRVWHAAWRPQGDLIATCSGDKTIRLWGREGDKWVQKDVFDDVHSRTVRRVAFSPDGKYLASASFDSTCNVFELRDGKFKLLATLEGHENEVKGIAWDCSGSLIATCSRDKSVWIWEMGSDKEFECISVLHSHTQDVKSVLWHPSREMLISCSYDDTLKMWLEDEDDWFCAETLAGHASTVWEASFNADGKYLVSCSEDKSIIIWQYTEPQRKPTSMDVYDVDNKCWQKVASVNDTHTRSVYSVDWRKCGTTELIATASGDDALRIFEWDASTSSLKLLLTKPKAHQSDLNCVRWSPTDPTMLVTTSDDLTVKIWRYAPQ